ncbi:MAG: coproporphyrinogen dehydrogenase HemZ [Bacillota bacterium]|nr:coproporphyrinogen dehydrogenase HemZ [Bacillota bacterium]
MKKYRIASTAHRYDIENIIRIFGYQKADANDEAILSVEDRADGIAVSFHGTDGAGRTGVGSPGSDGSFDPDHSSTHGSDAGRVESESLMLPAALDKNERKRRLYRFLEGFSRAASGWGILVGVRPVKVAHKLMSEGKTEAEMRALLRDDYLISPEKIELMLDVAKRERPFLDPSSEDRISLYLSIPFCPTRCTYCSFPAVPLSQKGHLLPAYLERLAREVDLALEAIRDSGRMIDCLYIGGGTPSVLDNRQIRTLFESIYRGVDRARLEEITFEAGRVDTLDEAKIDLLRELGVTRLSINPQSFTDEVLAIAGRYHDAARIRELFDYARSKGFLINSDLIVGLPGETPYTFESSLKQMLQLRPHNLTVHALSLKRGSKLNEAGGRAKIGDAFADFTQTYDDSMQRIRDAGLYPYYLYRQKNISGNLENVGYAVPGTECIYNIRIIEEKHTIIACGVGAVSKICFPAEDRHEQVPNPRGIEDYLTGDDSSLAKWRTWFSQSALENKEEE